MSKSRSRSNKSLATNIVSEGIAEALKKVTNRLTRKTKQELEQLTHNKRIDTTKNFLKKAYDLKTVDKFLKEKQFLKDIEDELKLNSPLSQSLTSPSQSLTSPSQSAPTKSRSKSRTGGKKSNKKRVTKKRKPTK
jgi:hypothetical protein